MVPRGVPWPPPPEVYRGPCIKITPWKTPITYTYVSWKTTGYYRKDSLKLAARCPVSGCWPSCFFIGRSVGLGPEFLDSGSQLSLNGSPRNLHTSLVWVKPENLPANFCSPPVKNLAEEKAYISTNFRPHDVNRKRVTSKRFNISTNKNKMFHLYDKCAENGTKRGASPHEVLMQPKEKISKL